MGLDVFSGAEASGDFLFVLAHSQVAFSAIAGEGDVGMLGEQQHGALVLVHLFPQIVGVGLGHSTALSIFVTVESTEALAQRLVVAFGDLVASTNEEAAHARGLGIAVGINDEVPRNASK